MSPRNSRKHYGAQEHPQLPPRKRQGYWLRDWLTPTRSSMNYSSLTAVQASALAQAGSSLAKDRLADSETARKKRRYAVFGLDMEEEQVTRDLCTSFLNLESGKRDVVPWRSSSNSPNEMQSGTTSEEDWIRDGNDNDSADTVRSAAELLTQLTWERNGDTNCQFPDVTSNDPQRDDGLQRPIRWGVKKKVSYESRRSVDSCDLGLCTGLIRKFSYDQEKAAARTPAHMPDPKNGSNSGCQGFSSSVLKWDQSSPDYPASSKFYEDRISGVGGAGSKLDHMTGVDFQGARDKHNKTPSTSRACQGNILKLPKEMQGRWSCERYRTAQLKLIDIMHARKAVPGKPILRPALREEARKHIGDTGLLDHLLKHMTDTVVSTGERFRRRHNSEGAMEYWLEHASLMELRKAAGVEDPSWIPPMGWKAGDKLPDRNWPFHRGITSSEAAELEILKDTVERLKSEMGVLCGSIKVSNQRGMLTTLSISQNERFEDVTERVEVGEEPAQGVSKDVTRYTTDTTNMELQQNHQERSLGANMGSTMERIQNHENGGKKNEDQNLPKEISASSSRLDLESQLQDVRKTVAVMQAEVSQVINMLGIVQPIKATPVRFQPGYQLDPCMPADSKPIVLSVGDETCSIIHRLSPENQPPGTSEPVLHDFVIPKLDASLRQCSSVKNATRSSNVVGLSVPYTDGLSQALSNYNLSKQPSPLAAYPKIKLTKKNHVQANTFHSRAPSFKPLFTSQPTGFRICRPPGSFVWPSMVNVTSTNNPPVSGQGQNVEFRGLEVTSGITPTTSMMAPSNFSNRSLAETQVAATMATMFGCMAMAPPFTSIPTLPLLANETEISVKSTQGAATDDLPGQASSSQSNSALSLSLSLSVPSGIPHSIITPSLTLGQ